LEEVVSEVYHINPETGRVNKCYAKPGNCRFGADATHYDTKEAARAGYEESMAGEMLTSSKDVAAKAATEFARLHDEKIMAKMEEVARAQNAAMSPLNRLAWKLNLKLDHYSNINALLEQAAKSEKPGIPQIVEQVKTAFAEVNRLKAEQNELDRGYKGWSRFFIVPGGHIHSSMSCHTCNKSWNNPTQFGWLPGLSGKSDADAVKEQGALLCTVCYPDAPTEWTNHYEVKAAEKKAAACEGSGTWNYPRETSRTGYYTGNYGVCKHCNQRITITSTGKMRSHKPA
jgi:hypothetical protein